jgi:hypothetical protein
LLDFDELLEAVKKGHAFGVAGWEGGRFLAGVDDLKTHYVN